MSSSIYSLQVPAAPGLSCWAITMGLGCGENKGARTCSTNSYSDPEQAPEAFSSLFLKSGSRISCGLQNERLWSSPLPSFCCVLCLLDTFCQVEDTPFGKLCDHRKSSGNSKTERYQPKDEIIDLRILRKTQPLQDTKKISGLANSFLTIKKDLCLCHAHMTCPSGEEAMEKYSQLMSHFEEVYAVLALLQPQAAVVKALGELDILLSWMEEMD
ncbi:hypothetical protein EI555_012448 [Monodon monoceros]|uniref:Uncharacterized protein n=1 Tax=Monodon monoceros TaxID=40151 RepID=A0A4U1FDI6_MONMO|nr:hypothetical protein EI555_012448 [Monodon monoceros]